jgi:hypothetical protein
MLGFSWDQNKYSLNVGTLNQDFTYHCFAHQMKLFIPVDSITFLKLN